MVRTRSQLENLSKEELIEELISVEDTSSKLSDLTSHCDDNSVPATIVDVFESSICRAFCP